MLSAMETMMKAHPAAREKAGTLSAMETMMKALPRRGREREKIHCMGNAGGSGDKFESSVS